MQDVSYNLLADVILWLLPGQLQATGAEGQGLEPVRGLGQLGPLIDGEAGAGLVGAGAVLCNALIDGLVLSGDTSDGKCPTGGDRERLISLQDRMEGQEWWVWGRLSIVHQRRVDMEPVFPDHRWGADPEDPLRGSCCGLDVKTLFKLSQLYLVALTVESVCHVSKLLRVSVGELDVAAGRQQFAALQPDEVGLRDAGRRAAEHSTAPCCSGDRLRPLDKLWRG